MVAKKPGRVPFKFHDLTGYSVREYRVYDEVSGKAIGRSLVLFDGRDAMLYDIQVLGKYKRLGYASAMVTAMQNQFNTIVTSWYSEGGKKLCLKHGFEEIHDGKVPKLAWVKEEKDGTEDTEKSGRGEKADKE